MKTFRFDAISNAGGPEPEIVRFQHRSLAVEADAETVALDLLRAPNWPRKADAIRVTDGEGREVLFLRRHREH
jgi:hypothetical protein